MSHNDIVWMLQTFITTKNKSELSPFMTIPIMDVCLKNGIYPNSLKLNQFNIELFKKEWGK